MAKKISETSPALVIGDDIQAGDNKAPTSTLVLSRRHFLTQSSKQGALMLLAARAGVLLGGASLVPKLSPSAQANPFAWAIGRFLLNTVLNRYVRRRAVRIIARTIFSVARWYVSNRYGSSFGNMERNIQKVTQQVSASGYTQVHPETFVMSGTAENPSSYAYVAGHENGVDCCVVIIDSTGSNPIYLNGAVAAAFAHISDNWGAFTAQNSHINIDARSALIPVSPSAQQSLRSGFNYDYPASKVYPTSVGSVRVNYNVVNQYQGRLDVHIYYGSQSIYWDSFVLEFA